MIDTPQIVLAPPQLTASVALKVPSTEIQGAMGGGMRELSQVVASQQVGVTGPMFAYHFSRPGAAFDLEISLPVATAVRPEGRVQPGKRLATTVARTVYRGGYEGLGAGWNEFHQWIAGQGLSPSTDLWECYVTGPESGSDTAGWQTELNQPLAQEGLRAFVFTRMVDAPPDVVFQAWTEKEHLLQWFGPRGVTIPVADLDLRAQGSFHYCMRMPDGSEMGGKWVFREIVPSQKIVLVNSFSDQAGGLTRHPLAPEWPLELLSTTTFTAEGDRTRLRIVWSPLAGKATAAEIDCFQASHESMVQGWTGTIDQLTAYLATV